MRTLEKDNDSSDESFLCNAGKRYMPCVYEFCALNYKLLLNTIKPSKKAKFYFCKILFHLKLGSHADYYFLLSLSRPNQDFNYALFNFH